MRVIGENRIRRFLGWGERPRIKERLRYIAQRLPTKPIVLEAGAHHGHDTLAMSWLWPDGVIHAFEPVPSSYRELTDRLSQRRNVRLYPMAMGPAEGEFPMFISTGNAADSSSLLKPTGHLERHPEIRFESTSQVRVTTLDRWANEHSVKSIDFMWLDMQGAEYGMLQASSMTLPHVRAVYMEVSFIPTYENIPLYPEVREWMTGQGFRIDREWFDNDESGDVLFVR
jgi:FkbM family methyltransferase